MSHVQLQHRQYVSRIFLLPTVATYFKRVLCGLLQEWTDPGSPGTRQSVGHLEHLHGRHVRLQHSYTALRQLQGSP